MSTKYLGRRTGKLFERNKERSVTGPAPSELGDDPYAVTNIAFSADTRVLAVTGSTGQVERRITAIFVSAKTATKVWWKFNDHQCSSLSLSIVVGCRVDYGNSG